MSELTVETIRKAVKILNSADVRPKCPNHLPEVDGYWMICPNCNFRAYGDWERIFAEVSK